MTDNGGRPELTLASLRWIGAGATDIHLLPGLKSPQLNRMLEVVDVDDDGKVTITDAVKAAGVTITFTAGFKQAPSAHGVTLDQTTGEVAVGATLPDGQFSFIVTATASQGARTAFTRIRINVHDGVQRFWLTPNPLTVRQGAGGVRMSVLAQFSDGVIGDISNWSPGTKSPDPDVRNYVHATGATDPALTWSSKTVPPQVDPPVVSADPFTGVLSATAANGDSATIVVDFDGAQAEAVATCAPPWSTPVQAEHLLGPGWRSINVVPNVLFLPDGFKPGELDTFRQVVRNIAELLDRSTTTRPFADLHLKLNYFMAWVPSREAGVSVLPELDRNPRGNDPAGRTGVTTPRPSVAAPGPAWGVADLIREVGLPTPRDDPTGSTVDAARLDRWGRLYDDPFAARVGDALLGQWLRYNDRVLLNERDTAFHMAFGSRPALDGRTPDRSLLRRRGRLTDDDLNAFLGALQDNRGITLDNRNWSTGKDRHLVVVVCRSNRHGVVNATRVTSRDAAGKAVTFGRVIGLSLGPSLYHRLVANPMGNGFDVDPSAIPQLPVVHAWLNAAHELAHSWGLGDEYAEFFTLAPPDVLADTARYPNLVTRASLDTADHQIDIGKIKWADWARIAHAGAVLQLPSITGPNLSVRLEGEHVEEFRRLIGKTVWLRTRPLASARVSRAFKLITIQDNNDLILTTFDGTAIEADFDAKFGHGTILFAPVGNEVLTNIDVMTRVGLTSNPLNANPNDAPNRGCVNRAWPVPTPAINFPDRRAPQPPSHSAYTIGIYENGGRYTCGIYRPTGICLMTRTTTLDHTECIRTSDFCLVCRYALVDAINPTRHRAVDNQFQDRYGGVKHD